MRSLTFGLSIVLGVGLAGMMAGAAFADQSDARGRHAFAQTNAQQRMVACTRDSQVKVVGNRPTLMQERDVFVRRCMGIQ